MDIAGAVQECLLELVYSGSTRSPLARLCETCRAALDAQGCELYVAGTGDMAPMLLVSEREEKSPHSPLTFAHWKALATVDDGAAASENARTLLFPLRHDSVLIGAVRVCWSEKIPQGFPALDAFTEMMPLLARIMVSVQLAQQQRRHDLYEERAAISRELHDSLAQSLTYLKIQASRLDQSLARGAGETDVALPRDILGDLRDTLSDAYRQLRELMTTFRLTMHGKSFRHAVRDSVDEFSGRSKIGFELDNSWRDDVLSVEEEMQVLQIVREGLYNVVRHSRADLARISLGTHGNEHRIIIEDNGIGMPPERRKVRHHGLVIMQERTRRLDGAMRINTPGGGGTRIEIGFTPRTLRQ